MIGKLSGSIDLVAADHAVIDVGGVGYVVQCPAATLGDLKPGARAILWVETQMSETAIRLYGFAEPADREWFRLLQQVQGVGARVALAVLSVLPAPALGRAVALQDKAAVGRASGVGPKLAQRIVAELKDKGPALGAASTGERALAASSAGAVPAGAAAEAVSALINLGYGRPEALAAIAAAQAANPDAAVADLIRLGLKELAR